MRSFLLPLLLIGCGYIPEGEGVLSDGTLVAARIVPHENPWVAGYSVVTLPDGTECRARRTAEDYRKGIKVKPITCSDGRKGTARYRSIMKQGGNETTHIHFQLNDGTSGRMTFETGWSG